MPATVTLASTTLAYPLNGSGDTLVSLASGSGITPGLRLFVDRELMTVVSAAPASATGAATFLVLRGRDGTMAQQHDGGATVYIGRGDQFYDQDPEGAPTEAIPVSPWINVRNGRVWFAQGDVAPTGVASRWWQQQTATYSSGPLGVRIVTLDPTSST